MSDINSLLKEIQNKILKSHGEKDIILNVINKKLNLSLNSKDLDFKKETIFIKANPYIKAEINLQKNFILKEIKKQGIDKTIKDIK
ncbi:MAG: hypothetical protein QG580_164 [Patescibacteria group bacterium]|nr:hypothetical protein [Patescibacteria group bacterium]